MSALVQAKLTPATALDAMVSARRYGGEDALAAGIVSATAAEEAVLADAVALAAAQAGKDGTTLGTIKSRMYTGALAALADRDGNRLGS
jgi:enoyl-CoA hydratase/carnithine racemase